MPNPSSGKWKKNLLPILVLVAIAAVYGGSSWLGSYLNQKLGVSEIVQVQQSTPPAPAEPTQAVTPQPPKAESPTITTNPIDLLKRQVEQLQQKVDESGKPTASEPFSFTALAAKFLPMVTNLIIGALWLFFAYLIFGRVKSGLQRFLTATNGSDKGKMVVRRVATLLYWIVAIVVGLSIISPDLLTKLFLGVSIVGAAITLALQGVAKDFVCGVFMQFSPKFEIGDEVSVVGVDVKGKVVDINYLSTYIQATDGRIAISNGELWSKAVKVFTPGTVTTVPGAPAPAPVPVPVPATGAGTGGVNNGQTGTVVGTPAGTP